MEVVGKLGMQGCAYVFASPDRSNIFYEVKPATTLEVDLKDTVEAVCKYQIHSPRVLIYCQSRNMCADIFSHFLYALGSASYHPAGADHKSHNRLFAMFHAGTLPRIKEFVLDSLSDPSGVVRVVIATVALGMGVDLHGVNTVIHYGAPKSIDDYYQESGRSGRTGQQARSTVFWKPGEAPLRKEGNLTIKDKEVQCVRMYLENTSQCRRSWLLRHFECFLSHSCDPLFCCDVCSSDELAKIVPYF